MCNKVETKAGDLYYNKISEQESFDKAFKFLEGDDVISNQHDIDLFIQDNINVKIPLDGP
jgi:RNA binding exosome subunit